MRYAILNAMTRFVQMERAEDERDAQKAADSDDGSETEEEESAEAENSQSVSGGHSPTAAPEASDLSHLLHGSLHDNLWSDDSSDGESDGTGADRRVLEELADEASLNPTWLSHGTRREDEKVNEFTAQGSAVVNTFLDIFMLGEGPSTMAGKWSKDTRQHILDLLRLRRNTAI